MPQSNPNRSLIFGLVVSLIVNLFLSFRYCHQKAVIVPPIDNSKYEHRIDSLEKDINKKNGMIEAIMKGVEAKAETVYVNNKKTEKDVVDISKYSDIKRLYDSLYAAR